MSKNLLIVPNILEYDTYETFECDNIVDFLREKYKEFPTGGRLYINSVCHANDVTPVCEADVSSLNDKASNFILVVYPKGGLSLITWVLIGALAVTVAAVILLRPKVPELGDGGYNDVSSNNSLSDRTNKPRLKGRIPDILGEVVSVCDLLAVPERFFLYNVEYELSYFCIGRGEYYLSELRDGDTLLEEIPDTFAAVWPPYYSINNDYELNHSQLVIGTNVISLSYGVREISACNSVDGLTLVEPQHTLIRSEAGDIRVNISTANPLDASIDVSGGTFDYSAIVSVGDVVYLKLTGTPTTMEGYITIVAAVVGGITFANFQQSVTNSYNIPDTGYISYANFYIGSIVDDGWNGPFLIDTIADSIVNTFVGNNGLYTDDGTTFSPFGQTIQIGIQKVDASGANVGEEDLDFHYIPGSTDKRAPFVGFSNEKILIGSSRLKIRCRRITATLTIPGLTVVDELKWRNCNSKKFTKYDHGEFGNVTTAVTIVKVNTQSLSIKDRKFNCLATRKIPIRITGDTFTTELHATKNAADIISFVCLDELFGNLNKAEIDFDSIYNAVSENVAVFGSTKCSEFCYTFDKVDTSFEEILTLISRSIFCNIYRQGNIIKMKFEGLVGFGTLLFNHRNILPDSQTRSVAFRIDSNHDGVEVDWIDENDHDLQATTYNPPVGSTINPKTEQLIGVRNGLQAYMHSRRLWNRLLYQRINCEFTSTQEGFLAGIADRVMVSDLTRKTSYEGEVLSQFGLELELSQPYTFIDGVSNTIFLQLYDGSIESRVISAGSSSYHVILQSGTSLPLVFGDDRYSKTTYIILNSLDEVLTSFLIAEKEHLDNMTCKIKAVNYDDRYYMNDSDFKNGIVSETGVLL